MDFIIELVITTSCQTVYGVVCEILAAQPFAMETEIWWRLEQDCDEWPWKERSINFLFFISVTLLRPFNQLQYLDIAYRDNRLIYTHIMSKAMSLNVT